MSADDPFGFSSAENSGATSRPTPSVFGATGTDSGATTATRTPIALLVAAIVVGGIAIVTAIALGAQPTMAIVAWCLAGPVGIGLYAAFRVRDTAARAQPFYAATTRGVVAGWTALIVLAAGVLIAALRIAQWIGHL
jgi:hypothetical protein